MPYFRAGAKVNLKKELLEESHFYPGTPKKLDKIFTFSGLTDPI